MDEPTHVSQANTPPPGTPGARPPHSRRRLRLAPAVIPALLLCAALALRLRGSEWPIGLHPDEIKISTWITETAERSYVTEDAYPSGFFTLLRPVRHTLIRVREQAHRWLSSTPYEPSLIAPVDNILLARTFNAWLGALMVLLVYAAAREATRSRPAACLAAALIACSPTLVEHAHYAETDIAVIFMASLSAWLWLRAMRRGSRLLPCLAACVSTGFTVGVKYSAWAILIVPALAAFSRPEPGARRTPAAAILRLLLFAIVVFGGLAWASPGITRWSWFREMAAHSAAAVYAERQLNLGPQAALWWAPLLDNLLNGLRFAAREGAAFMALAVAGFAAAMRREHRAAAPVLLVFPALYACGFVLLAPWVRSQEFAIALPVMAVLAALAIAPVFRPAAGASALVRGLAVALAASAVLLAARSAWMTSGLFAGLDARYSANDWLSLHAAPSVHVGYERYTPLPWQSPGFRQSDTTAVELTPVDAMRAGGVRYVLRNVTSVGRGLEDVRTGRLFPSAQENLESFRSGAVLLQRWMPLPGAHAAFAGPELELWALRDTPAPPDAARIDLPLGRPFLETRAEPRMAFPPATGTGAQPCLQVDRRGCDIRVGGPLPAGAPVYVILQTREREAPVDIRGLGQRARVTVPPYQVRVVKLARPRWRPRMDAYEHIRIRARTPRSIVYLPCTAVLAFSAAEAAELCLSLGAPAEARACLRDHSSASHSTDALQFEAAVAAGDFAAARKREPSARAALDALTRAIGQAEALALRGVPLAAYDDFARITQRYGSLTPLVLSRETSAPRPREQRTPEFRLPVRPVPGAYVLELYAGSRSPAGAACRVDVLDAWGTPLAGAEVPPGGPGTVRMEVMVTREGPITLSIPPGCNGKLVIFDLTLTWSAQARLVATRDRLQRALDRHAANEPAASPEPPPAPVARFEPFLNLTRVQRLGDTLRCEFTLTAESIPPLDVTVLRRRRGRWRPVAAVPVPSVPGKRAGNAVTVDIPLDQGLWNRIGEWSLAVRSRVEIAPGALHVPGRDLPLLPLRELLTGS